MRRAIVLCCAAISLPAAGWAQPADDTPAAKAEYLCALKDAPACYDLALMYDSGQGVPKNQAKATQLYQKACDGGVQAACAKLRPTPKAGKAAQTGVRKSPAHGRASPAAPPPPSPADLAQQSCDAGQIADCTRLAAMYRKGEGVTKDDARAAVLLGYACAGKDAGACFDLALMHWHGEATGWYDTTQAWDAFDRAIAAGAAAALAAQQAGCEQGLAPACVNLGLMYGNGKGVAKDEAKAASLYQKACDGGSPDGCYRLAAVFDYGWGVAVDDAKAAQLYQRACTAGSAVGCNDLGAMYAAAEGVAEDPARAAQLYRTACEGRNALACKNLAQAYDNGKGVLKDEALAADWYAKGCAGRNAFACASLGYSYEQGSGAPKDETRASQLYAQACEGGDMYGCGNLGGLYFNARGVPKDEAKAAQLWLKACDMGNSGSCKNLPFAEAVVYQRACDQGVSGACMELGNRYLFAKGVAEDGLRANELWLKGCELAPSRCGLLMGLFAKEIRDRKARALKELEKKARGGTR